MVEVDLNQLRAVLFARELEERSAPVGAHDATALANTFAQPWKIRAVTAGRVQHAHTRREWKRADDRMERIAGAAMESGECRSVVGKRAHFARAPCVCGHSRAQPVCLHPERAR